MVQVTADSEDISNKTDSFFKDFDLVVATNCSADQLVGSKKLFRFIHNVSLRLPHTSQFFVCQQNIFTCQLVCGEFSQVCDKIGACRVISDSARSQNVLIGLVG